MNGSLSFLEHVGGITALNTLAAQPPHAGHRRQPALLIRSGTRQRLKSGLWSVGARPIVRVESVMENGGKHYEGQVRSKNGKTVAMELDANGKPIRK